MMPRLKYATGPAKIKLVVGVQLTNDTDCYALKQSKFMLIEQLYEELTHRSSGCFLISDMQNPVPSFDTLDFAHQRARMVNTLANNVEFIILHGNRKYITNLLEQII